MFNDEGKFCGMQFVLYLYNMPQGFGRSGQLIEKIFCLSEEQTQLKFQKEYSGQWKLDQTKSQARQRNSRNYITNVLFDIWKVVPKDFLWSINYIASCIVFLSSDEELQI